MKLIEFKKELKNITEEIFSEYMNPEKFTVEFDINCSPNADIGFEISVHFGEEESILTMSKLDIASFVVSMYEDNTFNIIYFEGFGGVEGTDLDINIEKFPEIYRDQLSTELIDVYFKEIFIKN